MADKKAQKKAKPAKVKEPSKELEPNSQMIFDLVKVIEKAKPPSA